MDPTYLLVAAGLLTYFVAIPAATFLYYEHHHRLQWRRRELVRVPEHEVGGPFREEEIDGGPWERGYLSERVGAPASVKVVAVTSLVLGHMFIPGLFAALFGLIVYGLGLVAIPGLLLAAGIYRNAFGLLRCDPAAAERARELRRLSLSLNVVVLTVVGATLAVEVTGLALFTGGYALVSILHAEGLRIAAEAIEKAKWDELQAALRRPAVVRRAAPQPRVV